VSPAACAAFGGVRALAGVPRTRAALRRDACLQVLRSDEDGDGAGERALLAGTPHGALLVVPVLWRARPVGALQLLLGEERAFTRWEIARARVVAPHLGAVLAAVAEDTEPAGTAALASLAEPAGTDPGPTG
jgi:GAF domain-containing protein